MSASHFRSGSRRLQRKLWWQNFRVSTVYKACQSYAKLLMFLVCSLYFVLAFSESLLLLSASWEVGNSEKL